MLSRYENSSLLEAEDSDIKLKKVHDKPQILNFLFPHHVMITYASEVVLFMAQLSLIHSLYFVRPNVNVMVYKYCTPVLCFSELVFANTKLLHVFLQMLDFELLSLNDDRRKK